MEMEAAASHSTGEQPLQRDVVVVGASAGGVETLGRLVASLPADLPAAVLVVLHVLAGGRSVLGDILARAGRLPSAAAVDGTKLETGRIYVAPPDHHLLLQDGVVRLSRGPRENGHRPSIDLLFRSAAQSYGPRVIGVVLSGLLDDGAAGLRAIKERGGAAVVQSPDDALYPAMPRNAIAATEIDAIVPLDQMAETLARLLAEPAEAVEAAGAAADPIEAPPALAAMLEGTLTGLTCPECGGALWETHDGPVQRFSCHVGHSYSVESMVSEQGRALESALWGALRALEERADLLRRLAQRSSGVTRRRFDHRALEADEHADRLRDTLLAAARGPARDLDGGVSTAH
jgi:two-component system chemotaxis response regulator CheB